MCRFLTALTPDVLRLTTINTSGTFLTKNAKKLKTVFENFILVGGCFLII